MLSTVTANVNHFHERHVENVQHLPKHTVDRGISLYHVLFARNHGGGGDGIHHTFRLMNEVPQRTRQGACKLILDSTSIFDL